MTLSNKYHGSYRADFHYRLDDMAPLYEHMQQHPKVAKTVAKLMSSAADGACIKDCGPCGRQIKANLALAGVALFHGRDERSGKEVSLVSPICAICYIGGRDVLERKYAELIKEKLFGGDAEVAHFPGGGTKH